MFSGEGWIGLDKLHQLTSQRSYSLRIIMTDYDQMSYVAVYDQFKVLSFINICPFESLIVSRAEKDYILISTQVGAGDDYVLTVAGFNAALSTLGDSMARHNGMKFSTK